MIKAKSSLIMGRTPMQPVMVRLPPEVREQAKRLADKESKGTKRFCESDIYRTAIIDFLQRNFTSSKDTENG